MTPLDLARAFVAKAREDEDLLEQATTNLKVADSVFGFHAQQAAEKYLKAVLAIDQERPEWTHDLGKLARQCADAGHPFLKAWRRSTRCLHLGAGAVPARGDATS